MRKLVEYIAQSLVDDPAAVQVRMPDGSTAIELEVQSPALESLEDRVAAILAKEGDALRAGNLLLRERLREQAKRTEMALERQERGKGERAQVFPAVGRTA